MNDICSALKVLETNKNILLFYPYEFTFDVKHQQDEGIRSIGKGLTYDFTGAFEYREMKANGYDTFMTCLYDGYFLVFKIECCKMVLIDRVKTSSLKTFMHLRGYTL